jgi:hypothetical protein
MYNCECSAVYVMKSVGLYETFIFSWRDKGFVICCSVDGECCYDGAHCLQGLARLS